MFETRSNKLREMKVIGNKINVYFIFLILECTFSRNSTRATLKDCIPGGKKT